MHVVLSRQPVLCGNVCAGVYAETAKVKTLTDRETKMLPIVPTKVLSLSHVPSPAGTNVK